MMGPGGGGRNLQPVAEINVTSMVDVAFTLLIIFIITAPILQGGIEVAVPETDIS
ncbi:MAG: biopolymer transporter ExbD, partial [Gemmatimonadota bacterium]|nr:biopolymer transporter ExbD [Gemmatimonadota bacterium]